jgi:hypothetical protein
VVRRTENVSTHPAQRTLVESLAVALKTHVLRSYTPGVQLLEREPDAKPPAIQRAVDYIEQHLHEVATLFGPGRRFRP